MNKRIIIALILAMFFLAPSAYSDSLIHYKTYDRDVEIYFDGSYKIFETIEVLGMGDGIAQIELGSNFIIKSVKVSKDAGKTWETVGESNYIVGNVLKHPVQKDMNYKIEVQGQGMSAMNTFTTITPAGVDQVRVDVEFKFDNYVVISLSPLPTHQSDGSINWVFTDRFSKKVSVSFARVDNDAKLDAKCTALVLAGASDRMKLFCNVDATGLINRFQMDLPPGMAFSSFDSKDFAVESKDPLIITKNTPAMSFRINGLEFVFDENTIASMPVFRNGAISEYNMALYAADNYKIENTVSSFNRITKYEANFLRSVSGYLPSGYNLDSLYTGKSDGSLSYDKEKLKEKEHLSTSISSANYDIFPTKRGFAIVKANYQVVNSETGKYLELELPDNSVFWGAIVNSEPEKAYGEGNIVQIPMPVSEKYGTTYQSTRVTIFYVVTKEVFNDNIYTTYNLVLPKHKTPITNIYIKIGLPVGFKYWKTDVVPDMDATLVTYTPMSTYYGRTVNFDVAGASEKAMASQIEQMSMDAPVQNVQLSMHGTPITIQIPEMKKYVQITGGGESIIMLDEIVSISVYGFEESGVYLIYAILGIILLALLFWKKEKLKKLIW